MPSTTQDRGRDDGSHATANTTLLCTYFCTFVPAPIRRLLSRHVFCVAALLGGGSRPHVLPFHSLSVGLTLPFDEGPHFPCSRSREMESSCRCCDGMVAWGDRPLPIPCHLASPAPSRPGAVLVKFTPGPTAAPTQVQCARQNKREHGGRLPTPYIVYAGALDRTRAKFPEVLRAAPLSPK